MFASPNSRMNTQVNHENADALVARKAGASNAVSRKPLLDRAVNKKSPEAQGNKPSLKESAFKKPVQKQIEYPDWLMDTMSYVEVEEIDDYEDLWPKSERFTNRKNLISLLEKITGSGLSPIPINGAFEFDPDMLEIPELPNVNDEPDLPFCHLEMEDVAIPAMPIMEFDDFVC